MPTKPFAFIACATMLLGCVACTLGGKTPAVPPYYAEGTQALALGDKLATRGCSKKAVLGYFKAVEFFTLADDQQGVATCFNNIGNLYLNDKKNSDALHYYREAYGIHTRQDDTKGRVRALTNMAVAFIRGESLGEAKNALDQASDIASEAKLPWPQGDVVRASLNLQWGDAHEAIVLLKRADKETTKPSSSIAASLHFTWGKSLFALEEYEEALTRFSKALDEDRRLGALPLMVKDLTEMGRTLTALDRPQEARQHLIRALGIATLRGKTTTQQSLEKMVRALPKDTATAAPSVTEYFLERWTSGERFTAPCN